MRSMRLEDMERFVCARGFVPMDELCGHFGVSMNTVRRDIAELLKRGAVEKVYGGVSAKRAGALTPYPVRHIRNETGKKRVGQSAAELVRDDDVIFIDSGTTTLHMVEGLRDRRNLTIVTHSLLVISEASQIADIKVIVLPGQLFRDTGSFTGADTADFLSRYNIDTAFMATSGISAQGGVTNSSPLELEIKRMALRQSKDAVLLMDKTKFGHCGLLTYAPLKAFSRVVTDETPEETWRELLASAGAALKQA